MNKDKAIQLLERLQDPEPYEPMLTKDAYDAIQMAIDALSANGDTISRKAAIDALDEIEAEVAEGFGFEYEKWRKYFCDLPSAQSDVPDINVGDTISRQAVLVAVKDALIAWSYMPEWRDEKILEAIAELPPAQPVIVPCNYVKACNEATMDKLTSAVLYLNVLEELKKHGYVLVDMRKVER